MPRTGLERPNYDIQDLSRPFFMADRRIAAVASARDGDKLWPEAAETLMSIQGQAARVREESGVSS
jgi:hypothetical protein